MTWDYTKTQYKKQAKADTKWHIERLINDYERNGKKLKREILKKNLNDLNIDDNRRAFLELLLWNKKF